MSADSQLLLYFPLLVVIAMALLILPFYPAWREWRHPTDNEPLVVLASQTRNIITTARQFRKSMLVGKAVPTLLTRAISTFGPRGQQVPIYTAENLAMHHGGKLTEFFTEGSLLLGAHSRITGWAHSEKNLELGDATVAIRQISSAQMISLSRGCCFEQLHAPVIYFGPYDVASEISRSVSPTKNSSAALLAKATRWGQNGWRIDGDFSIPQESCFTGSLVITGTLHIGAGALVLGDVKVYKGVLVGDNATVTGAIFCEAGIQISRNCSVAGPLVANTYLLVGYGSVLGSAAAPTTITASSILVADGVCAHGTVLAREAGLVWGQV